MLIPQQSPVDLANALVHLHENKNLIQRYGENARKVIETKFEVTRMVKEIEKVYETVLKNITQ